MISFFDVLIADFKSNIFIKSKLVILLFRIANVICNMPFVFKLAFYPFVIFYFLLTDWLFGIEIDPHAKIGKGFCIHHGVGLVISGYAVIGENCVVRQGVTIGNIIKKNGKNSLAPVIANNVEFGANAVAIGEIHIGENVRVGAGAVVVKSVPNNSTVVGVPGKLI